MKYLNKTTSIAMLVGSVVVLLWLTTYQEGVIARQQSELKDITKAPCGFKWTPKPLEAAPLSKHAIARRAVRGI